MKLKDIFAKEIDRPIEGVIKADDVSTLANEVKEYELTNEIEKRLESFLDAYTDYENANGVWISGFFGSGKSHLLKMVSLLLANHTVGDQPVLDAFLEKCDDAFLQGKMRKAVEIPSESILFNIDQKADVISKDQIDALISVFVKVFDEHCGYYGKQAFIAQFERQLDEDGLFEEFKTSFAKHQPDKKDWEWGRTRINRMSSVVDAAYAEVTGQKVSDVIDKYRSDYKLSIEDFANQVKKYISSKGKNFRLNFFVDEAGQYIADNVKLMTNLQTVAESLNTKCDGQAWVIVTAQQDMNSVIGEMDKNQANDFSKIQDRFAIRLNLTSAAVREVIQKRLLRKTDDAVDALKSIYERERNNFKTLFDFTGGGQTYKNFTDEEDFIACYPFVPYQFVLFQLAIKNLSHQNAFQGKHRSVGERSMLGVFQDVAVGIAEDDAGTVGRIAAFDQMFEGISAALKSHVLTSIHIADEHLDNPLAKRLLKALFLVKYVREFKATPRNLSVLVTDSFDQDLTALRKDVETALGELETGIYVQRNGDVFEYLTDEEKDVEQAIANTEVDTSDIATELQKIIYDQIFKTRKIRYQANKQDFAFTRKLDDTPYGRVHELGVHVISTLHEHTGQIDKLKLNYSREPQLLIVLPTDVRLNRDLRLYKQTSKYVAHNISLTQKEAVKRILTNKQLSNQERHAELIDNVKELLSKARLFVNASEIESGSTDPVSRLHDGFDRLVMHAYPNLAMVKVNYTEANIEQCLNDADDGLFGNDATAITEAETNVLSFINRNAQKSIRTSIKALVEKFEKAPNGWPLAAIQCTLAKLIARGKVEARADGEALEEKKLLAAIKNTKQHANVLLEPQIEFAASQVRRLKDFYEQFFDGPPSNSDAKALGYETAEAFKELHTKLSVLEGQTGTFPFLGELSEPIGQIGILGKKSFKFFLTEFEGQADDLLDMKERVVAPIRRFMGEGGKGPQALLYKETKEFLDENQSNFSYIEGDEGTELRKMLTDPKCYKGNVMKDAKQVLDALKSKVTAKAAEEREKVEKEVVEKASRIKAIPGYDTLPDECRSNIDARIKEAVSYIKGEPLIAVVRESARQFEEQTYKQLLEKVDRKLNASNDSSGDDSVAVETKPIVRLGTINVGIKQPWLETEEQVDEYLARLRESLVGEIADGKRIQL